MKGAATYIFSLGGFFISAHGHYQTSHNDQAASQGSHKSKQSLMKKRDILKKSKTDWDRLKGMKDEEIDLSESPEIEPKMFARAIVRKGLVTSSGKVQLTLRIDQDVVEWFRKHGRGYQTKINALLRAYMEAHK